MLAALPLALAALALPGAAQARDGSATTYRAKLGPVVPAAEAATSPRDRDRGRHLRAGVRGKAKLVDGRRDKVRLHAKGLVAGAGYTWSLRRAAAGEDACAGEAVDAFSYRAFDARRRGAGRSRARSRAFAVEAGSVYAVVVTDANGADVACGEFATRKRVKGEGRPEAGDDGSFDEEELEDDSSGDEDLADDELMAGEGEDHFGGDHEEDFDGEEDLTGEE